jgi:hypothetical protein
VGRSGAPWLLSAGMALYVALAASGLALESRRGGLSPVTAWEAFVLLWWYVIGALIVRRYPRHPIGWIFCAAAIAVGGVAYLSLEYAIYGLALNPGGLPAAEAAAWLGPWVQVAAIASVGLFLPLLFPDGRLPSRRWRPVAWVAAALSVAAVLAAMFGPVAYPDFPTIRDPLEITGAARAFDLLLPILYVLYLLVALLCVGSVFLRLRRADPEQRLQIKWFSYAAALLFVSYVISGLGDWIGELALVGRLVSAIAITALPTAVGIAVLRYRLYDIDPLINRTLLSGLLTALLAGLYTASIALFQRAFVATTGQNSDLAIVLTIFVLVTVFTPLKTRLQTGLDRYFKSAPVGAAAAVPAGGLDDLDRLAVLHRRGVLTDEEFAAKKKQVLGI